MVIVAAYARTLRPGVSLDQFIAAWMPEGDDPYPARWEVAIDPTDDRRVLTLVRFDGTLSRLQDAMPRLVHPESAARLDTVVESTELQSIYSTAASN
jgi:hypothetical protein